MARLYTSFTKSKEAEGALKLLASGGYMVMRPKSLGAENAGSRGEYLLSVDTQLGYVGVAERLVYKGAVFIYSTGELCTRALEELNKGDLK